MNKIYFYFYRDKFWGRFSMKDCEGLTAMRFSGYTMHFIDGEEQEGIMFDGVVAWRV